MIDAPASPSEEPETPSADQVVMDNADWQRRLLPDPEGGCCCTWHSQYAGGGHTEYLMEYEPACPEHSEHVYNPRTGIWEHPTEPEWETEYGVRGDVDSPMSSREAAEHAIERMAKAPRGYRLTRSLVERRVSPWVPVKQEGAGE